MTPNRAKRVCRCRSGPSAACRKGCGFAVRSARPPSSARRPRARLNVCPECELSLLPAGARPHRPAARRRQLRGVVHRPAAVRSAGVQGSAALRRAAASGAGQDGHARRGRRGTRLHPRPAGGLRRHRFRLHGRQHGLGGRREADAGRRGGDALAVAVDFRQRLRRRRPHAGGHSVADADGQDVRRPGPLRPGRRPVHLRS